MMQRETAPEPYIDPYYIQRASPVPVQGEHRYGMDPVTCEFHLWAHLPTYTPRPGGILCERSGVGKSAVVLALVFCTVNEMSRPHPDQCTTHVTSDLARAFPQAAFHGADPVPRAAPVRLVTAAFGAPSPGERISRVRPAAPPAPPTVPQQALGPTNVTLAQIALYRLRTTTRCTPEMRDRLPLSLQPHAGSASAPYVHVWPRPPAHLSRVRPLRTPVRVYLTSATLLLVPLELAEQWKDEIRKHTEPGSLRVLVVTRLDEPLPSALVLAEEYDIVLMSHARFGKEASDEHQALRSDLDASPVMQVYWKRLVVDEGHVLAGESMMAYLCGQLRVERRWMVSATPTDLFYDVGPSTSRTRPATQWTPLERRGIEQMKYLLGRFLHYEPYATPSSAGATDRDWHSLMAAPAEREGEWASKRRWSDTLGRVMVRAPHAASECAMPPMRHRGVLLSLMPHEAKTYNVVLALHALHATHAHDADLAELFTRPHQKELARVLDTLSLAAFHAASHDLLEQAKAAHAAQHEGALPARAATVARTAQRYLEAALDDTEWQAQQHVGHVLWEVDGFDYALVQAWTRRVGTAMTSDQVVALRDAYLRLPKQGYTAGQILARLRTEGRTYASKGKARTSTQILAASNKSEPTLVTHSPNPLADTYLGSSTSTKLNAILNEILDVTPTRKAVVFAGLDPLLLELSAVLDIANVLHVCCTGSLSPTARQSSLQTFTHSPRHRCLLISIPVLPRGFDLHCASHIIFAEPVWQPELEGQAIRHVWRMGQTHAVSISTYAMRETLEERVWALKQKARTRTDPPALLEEPSVRTFVTTPCFVPVHDEGTIKVRLPLLPGPLQERAPKRRKKADG